MYLRLIAGFNTEQIRLQASGLRVTSDLLVDPSYLSFLGPLDLLIVSRGTGSYAFSRNVTSGAYTLQWIENTATAAIQPRISNTASAAGRINYFDNFRVLDLAPLDSRFATDYGLATSRLVSPIAGATTTSEADAVIETTITTLPSAGAITLRLRMQDAQNHWEVDLQSSGAMTLYERVANVPTARGNAAAVLVNGSQVVITLEGSVIKGYSDNVLRWTYSSATSFQTLTANEVATLGTGGVVSQITCWPRFVTLRSDL